MDNILFLRLNNLANFETNTVTWLLTNKTGKILKAPKQQKIGDIFLQENQKRAELAIIIPDTMVSYHEVEIPITNRKKRAQAIPYILEDKIIGDVDDMHFTVGPNISNNDYMVTVINKQLLTPLLDWLRETFSLEPRYILTDAICLYKALKDNSYFELYLNKENNIALLNNNKIAVAELENVELLFTNLSSEINCDIYSCQIDNVTEYLGDSIKKLSINSQQNIDSWLGFLVTSWFKNNIKDKFNIAHGLVKPIRFDAKFAPDWYRFAMGLPCLLLIFAIYKYLDFNMFTDIYKKQNLSIKQELIDLGIKTTNLTLAGKSVEQKINSLQNDIVTEQKKDDFFILLLSFSDNYTNNIQLNKILYQDNILEIVLNVKKQNLEQLNEIKSNLKKSNIDIKETLINDDKDITLEWRLTRIE